MPYTNNIPVQDNQELLNPEMNDLINYRPQWIIRNGISILFILLAGLAALSWFVQYPDIIKGSVRLVAINAPKLLVAKTEGKLEKLLVTNEKEVNQGQFLAFLQSTGKHVQVIALQKWISQVEFAVTNNDFDILLPHPLPSLHELGELQPAYQEFQNTLHETLQLQSNGYYNKKKRALLQDLQYMDTIQNNARRQQQLLQMDFSLQQTEFKAKESLAKDKVIPILEFNQDKSKIINKEQGLENISAQLINNNMATHNKKKEILDLQKYITDQQQKFQSALLNLKSKVQEWMQSYIATAPVSGKVLYASFLQENQLLTPNQELFYVQPPQSQYYGELMTGQQGLGKIKINQKVLIKVESYPSYEFGYLTGKVAYISNIPSRRDSFLIKVELPDGLMTNYGKTIFFRNNLSAQAQVITQDRRLADRFISQIKPITEQ